jgi:tetratricopeptide (TPR) repeat protein
MRKKNLSIFKIPYLILFTIFILMPIHFADAETKTFIKEYTYHAGDEDSRNSSRTIALREVKRLLLEELGAYLESQTEVINFQMTKDQITTLTAGIVGTEIIEDTWDGKVYWLKAKITADPQDVIKSIDSLRKDRIKVKELEELRKRSEELFKENERLNKELKLAKGGIKQGTTEAKISTTTEDLSQLSDEELLKRVNGDEAKGGTKQELAKAYKKNIDNLSATEWFERGYQLDISGNFTDAVKAYNKSVELDPQDTGYIARGLTYAKAWQ